MNSFSIVDYVVFGATILMSLGIGLYFALSGGRQRSTSEFLVGGRNMQIIPVALSLVVSFESSIMVLGYPAEVYVYGAQVWITCFSSCLTVFILTGLLVVPLMHPLKIMSVNEYIQRRFNSRAVRLFGTFVGLLYYVFYIGIVVFGTAIGLEEVTDIPKVWSMFLAIFAAIIYTAMGGIKAVVWTDVFQSFIMTLGILVIIIKGTLDVGGVVEVWSAASKGGRFNMLNFDPDPTVRHTFWGLYFGYLARGLSLSFNQSTVQRICSMKTQRGAQKVTFLAGPIYWLSSTLSMLIGIEGYYDHLGRDPLASGQITDPTQILPFLTVDIFKGIPRMLGLFVAAVCSASLSTISSGLSSLSATTWEDILKHHLPNHSDFKATLVAKVAVIIYGVFSFGVAILISLVSGTLLQISVSVVAAFTGPLCGLFIMAAFCPWANAKGAFTGTLVGSIIMMWICLGSAFSDVVKPTPWLPPASTYQCMTATPPVASNTSTWTTFTPSVHNTLVAETFREPTWIEEIYRLSYVWLGLLGTCLTTLTGFAASWITECSESCWASADDANRGRT
ncbi:sodium-dependent multivitamin transporter-like [Haliotis rufescens]|uniref:sodium-dependent multivitamin transporter-like n=1 Tax=Haliotis rufescens TaxID=6454 RepID=UPI00201ECF0F|nr:sodium-dependent multivitamin transporter-like [Haliotis rufescens]